MKKVIGKVLIGLFVLFLLGCRTTKIVYTVNGTTVIGTVTEK